MPKHFLVPAIQTKSQIKKSFIEFYVNFDVYRVLATQHYLFILYVQPTINHTVMEPEPELFFRVYFPNGCERNGH